MRVLCFNVILAFFLGLDLFAAGEEDFEFFPGTRYNPAIPTLEKVVGHHWGERITTHSECEDYLHALAGSSDRVRLFSYGKTWEGRKLYYLVIGRRERLADLEKLKADFRTLAHPLSLGEAEKRRLLAELPVLTWLAGTIHGNEPSGMDATLFIAYHLLAAEDDSVVDNIFKESVVIIDPVQNPDGRDRFAGHFRRNTGKWPAADPMAAERREGWPGGRTNHYLFDLNRDWFLMTQAETRGRIKAYLQWYPHVMVDLHEMGTDRTYYFPPPPPPLTPG